MSPALTDWAGLAQSGLQSVCPGRLAIIGDADNLWFLNFFTCRDNLTKLAKLRLTSLLAIRGVDKLYASRIRAWQPQFAPEVDWVGEMIRQEARLVCVGKTALAAAGIRAPALHQPGACGDELCGEIAGLARGSPLLVRSDNPPLRH